ncbi:type IV secretory system conjugative DNA transfer family protein [Rhizobium leguminosarum]|uniref:type IV secretory system conjugative DNA transfer family protein n=1 Tax=Rhizobium leguminosarum TaxID=384 RepID=UPI003AF30056
MIANRMPLASVPKWTSGSAWRSLFKDCCRIYNILTEYLRYGGYFPSYKVKDRVGQAESASWISFAAINDPETADYISRRMRHDHGRYSPGQSQFPTARIVTDPFETACLEQLIQPHEVLRMRADEQIV